MIRAMFLAAVASGLLAASGARAATITYDIDATYSGGHGAFPASGPVVGDIIIQAKPNSVNGTLAIFAIESADIAIGPSPSLDLIETSSVDAGVFETSSEMVFHAADAAGFILEVIFPFSAPELSDPPRGVFAFTEGTLFPLTGKVSMEDLGSTVPVSGTIASVPEPAAWMLVMLGIGLVGAGLRRRQFRGQCPKLHGGSSSQAMVTAR